MDSSLIRPIAFRPIHSSADADYLSDGAAGSTSGGGQRMLVRPRPSYPASAQHHAQQQDLFGQEAAAFHRYSDSDAVFNRSRLPYNTDYTRSTDLSIMPVANRYFYFSIFHNLTPSNTRLSTSDLEQSLTNSLNSYNNSSVYSVQQQQQQHLQHRNSQPSTPRRLRQVKRNAAIGGDDDDDYDVVPEFVDLLKGTDHCNTPPEVTPLRHVL